MPQDQERFYVAIWAALIRNDKLLLMKSNLTGFWELPGGRIEHNELDTVSAEQSFRREISEEAGLQNFEMGPLVDVMIGYSNAKHNPICRLVYLIKNDFDEIVLSSEHSEYIWISRDDIDSYQYYTFKNATTLGDILKKAFEMHDKL